MDEECHLSHCISLRRAVSDVERRSLPRFLWRGLVFHGAGEMVRMSTYLSGCGFLRRSPLFNQSERCVGCMVSSTTATRCSLKVVRSTSLRKVALKDAKV